MVERFHRELKTALMCHPGMSWAQSLTLVLLGIRNSYKDDLNTAVLMKKGTIYILKIAL